MRNNKTKKVLTKLKLFLKKGKKMQLNFFENIKKTQDFYKKIKIQTLYILFSRFE